MSKPQLSPIDWIKAAFRALTAGGPKAIRIEAIARDLKVSKGSFYWHFANAGALKDAMLAHWEAQATQSIIADLDAEAAPGAERLRRLVAVTTQISVDDYGGKQVETAIRDWARYDPEVAAVVDRIERQRLTYTARLFVETGCAQAVAEQNARLLYAGLIGLEQLSFRGVSDAGEDLSALLDLLLSVVRNK